MRRSDFCSPSPHEHGERAGVRGAFHTTRHQTPFVPSARPGGRIEGPAPIFPLVILSAAKYLASPSLKQCGVRWRACRILLTPRRSFSPPASYFLSTATRSNQETPPRCLRRSIADAIDRSPARLARGGVFRQAIPGLSENASASLPRPARKTRGPMSPRAAMLGAARRGRTSEAESKTNQKHLVIPAKAGIQGAKQCAPLPTPHPNPLPQGERGLKIGSRRYLTLPWLLMGC